MCLINKLNPFKNNDNTNVKKYKYILLMEQFLLLGDKFEAQVLILMHNSLSI